MIVDRGYLDHWKTHMLRQLTGQANAAELPLRLWEYCEWKRDDFIAGTDNVIAGICRAQMEPKALVKALLDCRWIDKTRGGFIVHGWRERNASWLRKIEGGKMRSQGARRGKNGQLESSTSTATTEEAASTGDTSNQLAGNTAGAVEWSGVEKSRETPTSPTRAQAREGAAPLTAENALSETWNFIHSLVSAPGAKKRRPGHEAEHALARQAEALPLTAEQRRTLEWFYALPHDELDVDLRSRYRNADRLAIHLFPALESAEAYAKNHGGPVAEKTAQKKAAPEPANWRTAAEKEFPGADMPATWEELCAMGATVRDSVLRRLEDQAA